MTTTVLKALTMPAATLVVAIALGGLFAPAAVRAGEYCSEDGYSRVPVSLLNPEGKILIFYGSFGVTANFAMVPKFEECAKKSTRELVK